MRTYFILLSIAVLILSCSDSESKKQPTYREVAPDSNNVSLNSSKDDLIKTQNALLDTSHPKIFNFIYKDSLTGQIPMPYALELIQYYRSKEGIEDVEKPRQVRKGWTKSVWFSLEEIEEIYKRIKSTKNGDGLRIYFAKYPDKDEYTRVPTRRHGFEDLAKKRTLVLVTTTKSNNGDSTSDDDVNEKDLKATLAEKYNPKNFAAYNHGELCPKNCGGTGF